MASRSRTAASGGGCSTTASLRDSVARVYADVAFGPAAAIYARLTDHEAWRRDCREVAALVPGPRVLDLGVGPGASALERLRADPALRSVGLDRSGAMLRRAAAAARAARLPLPLVRGDVLALPVRSGALDGATGHSFLYLLPDPGAALVEIRRAVRPGGRVAFLEPRDAPLELRAVLRGGVRWSASMVLWRGMSRLHRRFTGPDLVALLERAGFRAARAWPVLAGFGVVATAERP